MRVTLDGRTIGVEVPAETSLQDLIRAIDDPSLETRLVVGVTCNGAELANAELSERLACPVHADDVIDLISEDRCELATNALQEAADALKNLRGQLDRLASEVAAGRHKSELPDALAIWQVVPQAISAAMELANFDADREEFEGQTIAGHLGDLAEQLRTLRDAFQAQDLVHVSDLLRYEMPDLCERWSRTLNYISLQTDPLSDSD